MQQPEVGSAVFAIRFIKAIWDKFGFNTAETNQEYSATAVQTSKLDPMGRLETRFPVELKLESVPLSLQASAKSKDAWKTQIRDTIDQVIDPSGWSTESPVFVTIFYFPDGAMAGDIDNIVKPILDALMPRIYLDDSQVQRVWVQKFESERAFRIDSPTVQLAEAIDSEPPVVYIRIDDERSSEE